MVALTDQDRAVLDFERTWWKYQGAKEQAIREQLGMSAIRYYQRLHALVDNPAALEHDGLTVGRLRRLRVSRQRARNPRRVGL